MLSHDPINIIGINFILLCLLLHSNYANLCRRTNLIKLLNSFQIYGLPEKEKNKPRCLLACHLYGYFILYTTLFPFKNNNFYTQYRLAYTLLTKILQVLSVHSFSHFFFFFFAESTAAFCVSGAITVLILSSTALPLAMDMKSAVLNPSWL